MRSSLILGSVVGLCALGGVGCGSSDPAPLRRSSTNPPGDTTPGKDDTKPPPPPGDPPPAGTTIGDETWSDGKQISGNVTIAAGKTVVITPGATVTVSPNVAITIAGTLKATAGTTRAKLTGQKWAGLVVASGGTLSADSLDLVDVKKAIWTMAGNADATFANGTVTAETPFTMEPGSKLSVTRSSFTATSASALAGTFVASYLTYDKGTAEGLHFADAAGSMTISDSTLKGNGGGDYVVSADATLLKVEYTTISGSHCPLHFSGNGPTKYEIDHISDDTNGYGWMLYGSGAGPHTISNSNFRDLTTNIEMTGTNGSVTLTNNFFGAGAPNKLQGSANVVSTAPQAIANAKPR